MEGCLARKSEGRYQTLREHSERVSLLASRACPKLRAFAALLGLIHDLGKATRAFQRYIREGGERGEVRHAVHGAAFAFRRWRGGDAYRVLCAELIGYAVACHHSRLPDLLTADGDAYDSPEAPPGDLDEAVAAFCEQVASEDQLDALFESAVIEVKALYERIIASCRELPRDQQAQARTYQLGLALREAYSLLIDADRWDAYRFEAGLPIVSPAAPPWADWRARLENRLSSFDQTKPIARRRAQIAGECLAASASGSGVYRLCVPTGGGKTLSSLRMALASAQEAGRPRILYAAPYKAILEQTADTLREVFADDERILVHHGDVVPETLEDEARYRLLTQRWDSPLILTTMVQLLNTLFLGRSACARRFSALRGSVIILDEAQSIPPRLFYMLNMALRYLALCADCMIILCTATQPLLERTARYPLCTPKPVCRDEDALFRAFRRVRLTDQSARALSPDRSKRAGAKP